MPRLGGQRHVQRDDVRRVQQAIERHRLGAWPAAVARRVRCTRRASRMPAHAPRRRGRSGRSRSSPSCLPRSSVPSMKSNAQPFHSPRRTSRSPSDSRRVIARISAHVKSATDSVSTSGVLVTIDAARPRVRDVDVVVTDGDVRDHLQLRGRVDHGPVDRVGEHADQPRPCRRSRAAVRPAESALRRGRRRRRRPPRAWTSTDDGSLARDENRWHGDAADQWSDGQERGLQRPRCGRLQAARHAAACTAAFSVRTTNSTRSDCSERSARSDTRRRRRRCGER